MIKHIVMFQMKEDQQDKLDLLVEKLNGLKDAIDEVLELEVGVNFIESDRAMDVILVTSFESETTLDIYRTHPNHLPVVDFVKEVCSGSKVVDYKI